MALAQFTNEISIKTMSTSQKSKNFGLQFKFLSMKKQIKITNRRTNVVSALVKGTTNAVLGTNFKISREYDYLENGKQKSSGKVYSFSEFKKKKNL